jgi:hypothetical protein
MSLFPVALRPLLAASLAALPLLVALAPREAHAQMKGFKLEEGLFVPFGLNLGYSVNGDKGPARAANGFLLGPEISLVKYDRMWWAGTYADLLRDFGEGEWRASTGLEAGFGPVGVDFGYVGAFRGDVAHGVRVRGIVTLPPLGVYGGYGRTWTDGVSYGEIGVLFKIPLPIFTTMARSKGPPPAPTPIDPPATPATPSTEALKAKDPAAAVPPSEATPAAEPPRPTTEPAPAGDAPAPSPAAPSPAPAP